MGKISSFTEALHKTRFICTVLDLLTDFFSYFYGSACLCVGHFCFRTGSFCSKLHDFRYTDNWYNLINDVETGYVTMKHDVELALQDAQNNGQKVQNFNAEELKLQTGI